MNELFEIRLIILEARKQLIELAHQKGYVADYAFDVYEDTLDKIDKIVNPLPNEVEKIECQYMITYDKGGESKAMCNITGTDKLPCMYQGQIYKCDKAE